MTRQIDKTIPTNSKKILESHDIVSATHTLSLSEIRVIQLLLSNIYQKEEVSSEKIYSFPIEDYAKIYGITHDAAYKAILDVVSSIMSKQIIFPTKLVDPSRSDKVRSKITWFTEIIYDNTTSLVQIKWNPTLAKLLGNFKQEDKQFYSSYYLQVTAKLNRINSLRFYRLCNKWAKAGKFITEIPELKRLLGLEETEYSLFHNFRTKVIEVAVEDVNKLTDMNVEVVWIKKGVKVVKAEIKVWKKK